MRIKLFGCLFGILQLMVFIPGSQAGNIQVIGTGEVSQQPDALAFTINVEAKCYATPKEASQAADAVSEKLFKALQKLFPKKDDNNAITTHGGYTEAYMHYAVRNNPKPCHNTFQKTVQLTVNSTEMANFEAVFNQVQDLVYSQTQPPGQITDSITFTTMNQPIPQLSFKKYQALEKQASRQALQDAEQKAQYILADRNAVDLRLIAVQESLPNMPGPMAMRHSPEAAMMMDAKAIQAPVQFKQITVRKQLSAEFSY